MGRFGRTGSAIGRVAAMLAALTSGTVAAEDIPPTDPRLVAFRDALNAERGDDGSAPTVEKFYVALRKADLGTPGKALDEHMVRAAWSMFREMQRPAVSLEAIAELARSRREALRHVSITYRTERTGRELTPEWPDRVATECRFVRSDSKLFFEERTGGAPGRTEECDFASYDGEVVRERWGKIESDNGSIRPLEQPGRFYDGDNPLGLMLAHDARLPDGLGKEAEDRDLALALDPGRGDLVVQERLVTIDGRECLLLNSPFGGPAIHVDAEIGCGLVRYENQWLKSEPEEAGKEIRLVVGGGTQVDFADYREVGGVWIPFRIRRTSTFNGVADDSTIVVESCEIGRPIGRAAFSHVFPAWWTVQDHVRRGHVRTWPFGIEAGFEPL